MKFDELKRVAVKVEPPPPVIEGEEVNEAFDALGDPAYNMAEETEEVVVFSRCAQCAYFSITNHCPRCKNHPKMIPVDFVRVVNQMETVGRVCCNFATGTCIEHIDEKSKWCGDCVAFWDREFDQRTARLSFPAGMNQALLGPKKTKQELEAYFEEASKSEDEEEWEDELEETQEKLDKACSLLINIKYLLEFLADANLKNVIEPQDRLEMKNYSTTISDVVGECGFDIEEYVALNSDELFNERDKELLERVQEEQDREGQGLNRLMDRL